MKPSPEFLAQLPDAELLNYCEAEVEEYVTSNTELALIIKFREVVDNGGFISKEEYEGVLTDVSAKIPGEDFLADLINELHELANKKLKKDELIECIQGFASVLEDKQQELASGFEFAHDVINKTLNPNPRGK